MVSHDKKVKILIGVNGVLLVLIALAALNAYSAARRTSLRCVLLADSAAVYKICIESDTLMRKDDAWYMQRDRQGTALPANAQRVNALLDAIASVRSMEPVAGEAVELLWLAGPNAKHVTLHAQDDGILGSFVLGKYAEKTGHSYIAVDGYKGAWLVSSGMASYIRGNDAAWIDTDIWNAKPRPQDVEEIIVRGSLVSPDGNIKRCDYNLARKGGAWITSSGLAVDTSKAEALLRAVIYMRGADYTADAVLEPSFSVRLRLGNGSELALDVRRVDTPLGYIAKSSQRSISVSLMPWTLWESIPALHDLTERKDTP